MSQTGRVREASVDALEVEGGLGPILFVLDKSNRLLTISSPAVRGAIRLTTVPTLEFFDSIERDDLLESLELDETHFDAETTLAWYRGLVDEALADDPSWGMNEHQARIARALIDHWGEQNFDSADHFLSEGWRHLGETCERVALKQGLALSDEDLGRIEEVLSERPFAADALDEVAEQFWNKYWGVFVRSLALRELVPGGGERRDAGFRSGGTAVPGEGRRRGEVITLPVPGNA